MIRPVVVTLIGSGARPIVIAKSPDLGGIVSESEYEIVRRGRPGALLRAFRRSDLVLLGGGTHYQDNFSGLRYVRA